MREEWTECQKQRGFCNTYPGAHTSSRTQKNNITPIFIFFMYFYFYFFRFPNLGGDPPPALLVMSLLSVEIRHQYLLNLLGNLRIYITIFLNRQILNNISYLINIAFSNIIETGKLVSSNKLYVRKAYKNVLLSG